MTYVLANIFDSDDRTYWSVLNKERHGEYEGHTVQVIPHITNKETYTRIIRKLFCHIPLLHLIPRIDDELLGVVVPIAQGAEIVVAVAEPAVVHDEQLDTEVTACLCKRNEIALADIEIGRFP